MNTSRTRLDRFISRHTQLHQGDVKRLIAQNRITINGELAKDVTQLVNKFTQVSLDNTMLPHSTAHYLMLHKPTGMVSATKDNEHRTVLDLIDSSNPNHLHIVGRLDLNTSGLVLLTNDGEWSRQLTSPENKIEKRYRVRLNNPVTPDYIKAFKQGMYFSYENITTRPATLIILSDYEVEVCLTEGRYHQIKRMFGQFRNPVVALHRISIGHITLDEHLDVGDFRPLNNNEITT